MRVPKRLTTIRPMTLLILGLVIALVSAILLRYLTPPAAESQPTLALEKKVLDGTKVPSSVTIQNNTTALSVPRSFLIQKFEAQSISLQFLASKFKATTQDTDYSMSTEDGLTNVSYDSSRDRMTIVLLSKQQHFTLDADSPINENAAQQVAKLFAANTLGIQNITLAPEQTEYVLGTNEYESTTDKKAANAVIFRYYYSIDQHLSSVGIYNDPPVEVVVDKDNQVRRVDFAPYLFTPVSTYRVDSISAKTALDEYKNKSIVTRFYRENDAPIPLESIQNITLNSSDIVYQIDPNNAISMPYYLFVGVAKNDSNDASISFLVPAVHTSANQ